MVLLVISSVALSEPGRKDIVKRDKNSKEVVDEKMKSRLKQKAKGKGRSKRKRRKQSQKTAKNQKNKDGRRKIRNGGKDKKRNRMGKRKRKGRRRMKKMEKMISRCQNVTCLNDMLKVLKIKKDTVRNFMKQEKRLMGR